MNVFLMSLRSGVIAPKILSWVIEALVSDRSAARLEPSEIFNFG